MSQSMPATRLRRAPVEVAPAIAAAVGDISRPTADVPMSPCLQHLPGKSGLLHGIANVMGLMRRGNAHVIARARHFGPVFRDVLGVIPYVAVSDPTLVARILRNDDQVWSSALGWRVFFDGIDPTSKTLDSPVAFDFDLHREMRKVLQPAFSSQAIAGYVDAGNKHFGRAIDSWVALGRIAFKPEVRRLFATVSGSLFLGLDGPGEAAQLDGALADFWAGSMALIKSSWLSPAWRRGLRGHRILRERLRPLAAERRDRGGADLFSRMCQAAEHPAWLDDDTLVRLFIGIMSAAFDTTSHGCTSMAYLLASHPDWQERLRDECRSVAPEELAGDGTRRLEQLDWVWKETLRLYPVASAVPRRALRDVELGGFRIPAGTFVQAMLGPALHDERCWTAPSQFDPERFSPTRAEDRREKTFYLPFGAGAHACIGAQLANVEIKTFWHAMLTRCRIRLARKYDAHHEYRPIGSVSGRLELALEKAY